MIAPQRTLDHPLASTSSLENRALTCSATSLEKTPNLTLQNARSKFFPVSGPPPPLVWCYHFHFGLSWWGAGENLITPECSSRFARGMYANGRGKQPQPGLVFKVWWCCFFCPPFLSFHLSFIIYFLFLVLRLPLSKTGNAQENTCLVFHFSFFVFDLGCFLWKESPRTTN